MDPMRFDRLTKHLIDRRSRRHLLSGLFTGLTLVAIAPDEDAWAKKGKKGKKGKKKKRNRGGGTQDPGTVACAARCPSGCCTGEFGECIEPAQQGGSRCGTGGEPCHACQEPTPCAAACATGCCTSAFGECVEPAQQGGSLCGTGGELCHACEPDICAPLGGACDNPADCCTDPPFNIQCAERRCCRSTAELCTTTDQCCAQHVCEPESEFDPEETRCLGLVGVACAFNENCAGSLVCRTGRCCVFTRRDCEIAADCCRVEELCQQTPISGTRRICCGPPGDLCVFHGDCCSGNCNGGVCV